MSTKTHMDSAELPEFLHGVEETGIVVRITVFLGGQTVVALSKPKNSVEEALLSVCRDLWVKHGDDVLFVNQDKKTERLSHAVELLARHTP